MNTTSSLKAISRSLVIVALVVVPTAAIAQPPRYTEVTTINGKKADKNRAFFGVRTTTQTPPAEPPPGTTTVSGHTRSVGAFAGKPRGSRETIGVGVERSKHVIQGSQGEEDLRGHKVTLGPLTFHHGTSQWHEGEEKGKSTGAWITFRGPRNDYTATASRSTSSGTHVGVSKASYTKDGTYRGIVIKEKRLDRQ